MANAAATEGDKVQGNPATSHKWPVGSATQQAPCGFKATINSAVSATVLIDGEPAATKGSVASKDKTGDDTVPGLPTTEPPPSSSATITGGSATVFINKLAAARDEDAAKACAEGGKVVVAGARSVFIGD